MPATAAQQIANRENAIHSTGPRTLEGKARSSRNAVKLGLFTAKDHVLPDEEETYQTLCEALWLELYPIGALEELHAVEVIRASWRLQRCARIEGELADQALENTVTGIGSDPMQNEAAARTQTAVDRARTNSHNAIRRATAELRRLQTNREIAAATEQNEASIGICDLKAVSTGILAARKANNLDTFEKLLLNADQVVAHNQHRMTAERAAWESAQKAAA